MSIAVNNTQLQDLDPDHPFHAIYKTCTDWIKKEMPEIIEFDFPKEMIVPPTGELGSRESYPPTMGDVPVHVYSLAEGSWEIRYFTQSQVKDGALAFIQPVRIELGRRVVDKIKNIDLAFWLMFVNPYFDVSDMPDKMKKYCNLTRDIRHYVLVDLQKEARKLVEQETLITRAKMFLFGTEALTGSKLDNVAATIGVANVAGKTPEMLVSDLNKMLFAKDEKGLMKIDLLKDFIRMCEAKNEAVGVVLEFSKLASTLLEKGIIKKFKPDPDKNIPRLSVYVVDESGERLEHVCDLRTGQPHIQAISEALSTKQDLVIYLQKRLK